MSRNRILACVVMGLLLVMVGALLYQAYDTGDTQPFGVDPELPFSMLGSLLLFCVGAVVLAVQRAGESLRSSGISFESPRLAIGPMSLCEVLGFEHLLFSPPLPVFSLRV